MTDKDELLNKFKSGNSIPVERITVTKVEVEAYRNQVAREVLSEALDRLMDVCDSDIDWVINAWFDEYINTTYPQEGSES